MTTAFQTPSHYVAYVEQCLRDAQRPDPPRTRAELVALALAHPDVAYRLAWPNAHERRYLGLPARPEDLRPRLSDRLKEAIVAALVDDDGFRDAVADLIGEAF